jgi:hypothetical protein
MRRHRALLVAMFFACAILHASEPQDKNRGFRLVQRLGYNMLADWELSYKYDYYYDQYQPGLSDSCRAYDYDQETGAFEHDWTHYITYDPMEE